MADRDEKGRQSVCGKGKRSAKKIDLDDLLRRKPAWVQKEIKELRKHESIVLEALENPDDKELFLEDPAAFLTKHNIPASGPLKQIMRGDAAAREVIRPVVFRLPNGEELRPRIRINFTKGRE